jgi:hypothetical protein
MLPNASTASAYGVPSGGFQNANPVRNPKTDWDASSATEMIGDVASMTRTSCRAWAIFQTGATTLTTQLVDWEAEWKALNTNAPPFLTRGTTGQFAVNFPALVGTEIDPAASIPVLFREVEVFVLNTTTLYFARAVASTSDIIVQLWNTSFAATDAVGTQILVKAS